MMNPPEPVRPALVCLAVGLAAVAACEKKESASSQRGGSQGMAVRAPVAPRASVGDLRLHPKVQFPEERLPEDPEGAQAVADLASAVASGDANALRALLSPSDATVLGMLVESGQWTRQADATQVVRVCVINHPADGSWQVGLGVQDSLGAFLMGWEASTGGDPWTFASLPIEPRFAQSAVELDGAELKLLAMPAARPVVDPGLRPAEQKKGEDDKKSEADPGKPPTPGGLSPDKF